MERLAELLGAALQLVGELVDNGRQPDKNAVTQIRAGLAKNVEQDDNGRPQLQLQLPNTEALDNLATTLAKLLVTK